MGRHQLRLLKFALDYPFEWHGYGTDRNTVRAINTLASIGVLELSDTSRQFHLRRPRR